MARKHALFISLLLGLAMAAGGLTIVRTAGLGQPAATASDAQLLKRERLLDRQQRALRRALAKRPPALPKAQRAAQPVSAPVERHSHGHHHGDDDDEFEREGDDD
jgi:hypothetical protein